MIFADWQEATEFNFYYQGQVTEANVARRDPGRPRRRCTDDFKYAPDQATEIPTLDNGGVKVPGDNGDAMTVTWKLRPDLKWSDGQPLTCDDYKYTQDWIMDKDNTGLFAGRSGYEDVTKFECTDPQTMVLHFGKVYEGYLGMYGVPLPKHYMSKFSVKDTVAHKGMTAADMPNVPVSGPFKYKSVTPGQEIDLVRNDNYTNPFDQKPANLDELIFKWYGDADAMIAGYKSGDFDVAQRPQRRRPAEDHRPGRPGEAARLAHLRVPPPELEPGRTARPNTAVTDRGKGCPVSDPAIREAVRWAVNKDEINSRLLGGAAALGFTNVSPNAWFYSDPPTYTFDPEKAKSVLDAGGWTVGSDGIREKNGVKAKIELCTTTRQVRQDTLALVSSYLKDVGIDSVGQRRCRRPTSSRPTTRPRTRRRAPCRSTTTTWPSTPSRCRSTRWRTTPPTTPARSSRTAATMAAIKDTDVDAILDGVKGTVDFAKIKDADGRRGRRSTSTRRSRSRCTSARRSTSSARRS